MDTIWQVFQFFTTTLGLMTTGAAAALMLVWWNWRSALIGLCVIQIGVGAVAVLVEGVPGQWMVVQSGVLAVACLILLLSARRSQSSASFYYSGTWLLRLVTVLLLVGAWRFLDVSVTLPVISKEVMSLFTWLGLLAFALIALGESPLYTGVAMLLWCIPMQVIVAVLLAIPTLVMLIGILELLIALSCSYLILVENYGLVQRPVTLTDIAFPEETQYTSVVAPEPEARKFRHPWGGKARPRDVGSGRARRPVSPAGDSPLETQTPAAATEPRQPSKRPLLAPRRQ